MIATLYSGPDFPIPARLSRTCTGGTCTPTMCDRAGVDAARLTAESLFKMDMSVSFNPTEKAELYGKVDNVSDERAIIHCSADGARGSRGPISRRWHPSRLLKKPAGKAG